MTDNETVIPETAEGEAAAEASETKEIDWKAEARKHEQRAKDNAAKAKANEAAAQRLAELEAANQTEAEKTAAKLADAEKRAAELELKALRAEVANAKGVPAALLSGSTQDELEESAEALIAFRGEQKQAPSSSAIGRANGDATTTATPGDLFAAHLATQLGH